MINKRRKKAIIKLIILILLFTLVLRIFIQTLAKFESIANGNADVDVAFYVLKKDYQNMNLKLDSIFPQNAPYTYKFSISNTDGQNTADTDIEYNLKIRTTTNLPLEFKLFMNQVYTDKDAQSIIKSDEIKQDTDGTYFRYITTDPITLKYSETKTNVYQLIVYFPGEYNTDNYQDIIDNIEIGIDSNQVR